MQVPQDEQDTVAFLVLHHLALSEVMASRDLSDPATARAVADRVGTIERLKLLAVLTYADISGVNPGAMTPWRLEQLWRVYRVTQHELTRELETDRIQEVPENLASRAAFLKGFPVRYLRTHTAAEIESHVKLYELSRPTGVAVKLEPAGVRGAPQWWPAICRFSSHRWPARSPASVWISSRPKPSRMRAA